MLSSIYSFFVNSTLFQKAIFFASPMLVFLVETGEVLFSLFILMVVDFSSGIVKGIYSDRTISIFQRIKSRLLRRSVKKVYEYFLCIFLIILFEAHVLGKIEVNFIGQSNFLSKWVIILCCLIEAWSIVENINLVTGGNLVKKILSLLPNKIKDLMK